MEKDRAVKTVSTGPSPALGLTAAPTAPGTTQHPLPPRPDFAASANALGFGAPVQSHNPAAVAALGGSNHDVVANRAAIRMANMSAAETLKAELAGLMPVKASPQKAVAAPPAPVSVPASAPSVGDDDDEEVPGLGVYRSPETSQVVEEQTPAIIDIAMSVDELPDVSSMSRVSTQDVDNVLLGVKRSIDEVDNTGDDTMVELGDDEEDAPDDAVVVPKTLKVNADGTVDQEDTVKWVKSFLNVRSGFADFDHCFFIDCGSLAIRKDTIARNLV